MSETTTDAGATSDGPNLVERNGAPLKVRVEEWAGGLALRIPSEYADGAGIGDGSMVEMTLIGGEIVVRPEARQQPSLDELLDRITPENLHGEWETGPAVGNEAW